MAPRDGTGTHRTRRALRGVACLALAAWIAAPASADAFLDKANAAAAATPGTKPAHDVLMPALAAMTEPPVSTGWSRDDLLTLLMAAPGDDDWAALEVWADAAPQKAALEALAKITNEKEPHIIGFGYGREAVPAEWAGAGLYVGLNADGLLYSATFPYLQRVGWLVGLATFEAARAGAAGDGNRSMELCAQTFRLGRILTERAYLREMLAGASIMLVSLERFRDVMYQFESAFDAAKLREAAEMLGNQRIREKRLPMANYLAAEQIIARTFEERGSVDSSNLASLMSGARTQNRPLTRLSEAAFWADRAGDQADWFDTTDKLKGVWADWEKRWRLTDLYDPIFDIPSDFRKMDPNRFLSVFYPLNGIDELFDVRLRLLNEIAGTINTMGCVGFRIAQKTIPPQLASVTPTYIARLSPDLFNVDRRQQTRKFQPFTFWVPIRDQKWDRRETPKPHEVTVAMIDGAGMFVGAADNATERSMFSQIAPNLALPPGLGIEGSAEGNDLAINADELRSELLGIADKYQWTSDSLREFTAFFKSLAGEGITIENFDEKFDMAWAARSGDTAARMLAIGLDMQEVNAIIKDVARTLLGLSSVREGLETAQRGDQISADQAKAITKESIEAVVQTPITDRVTALFVAMREKAKAAIEAAGGEGLPTTVFRTTVGDNQFLLYSVGPNGVDDRARFVGRAGTDVLMWPPILSLQREARSAK